MDLLLSIEKTEATTVANRDTIVESQSATRRLCYSLEWKPDLDLSGSQKALTYCESARPHRDSATDFYEDVGYALVKFMSDSLDALVDQKEGPHQELLLHKLFYKPTFRPLIEAILTPRCTQV